MEIAADVFNNEFVAGDVTISNEWFLSDKPGEVFADPKFQGLMDSIDANVCILDHSGRIIHTNKAWRDFSRESGGDPNNTDVGVNYLKVCSSVSSSTGDGNNAMSFAEALHRIFDGVSSEEFSLQYPCSAPDAEFPRFCIGRACPFTLANGQVVTIVIHEFCNKSKTKITLAAVPTANPVAAVAASLLPTSSSSSASSSSSLSDGNGKSSTTTVQVLPETDSSPAATIKTTNATKIIGETVVPVTEIVAEVLNPDSSEPTVGTKRPASSESDSEPSPKKQKTQQESVAV